MNKQVSPVGKCPHISFSDPTVLACPVPVYKMLREEAPIYLDPVTGMYVVTKYEDARAIAADPATFANNTGQMVGRQSEATAEGTKLLADAGFAEVNTMVTNDPPDHRRYRSLVDQAFSIKRIAAIKPRIVQIASDLMDAFPQAPFDFVQSFAIWLPMRMIAEQLGVPPEMGDTFKRWSDATIAATDPRITRERHLECSNIKLEMNRFLWSRAETLRRQPNDTLISDIANLTLDDRPLTREEFCSVLVQLLVGGNETTTSSLASGMYHLATKPALQAELRANPDRIKAFSEEVLRLESPLQGLWRRATKAVTVNGVDIPEGAILNVRWAAGNRDPAMFPNPDEIDLSRTNLNQHLTFGHGIHYCIGNQLGRAELQLGFAALLARSRAIRLAQGEAGVDRLVHFMAHGPTRLMIAFDPA